MNGEKCKEELNEYNKKSDRLIRVCAANDLSGVERVSLTEIIPCLAAMGVEACPLPTAVLSTHTYKFTDYTFLDLTEEMKKIICHWRKLDIRFDAIYTGYLGSGRQIDILSEYIDYLKKSGTAVIVDPVLGDNVLSDCQSLYSDRMNEVLTKMKHLVSKADIITPNLTEASLLLDEEYDYGVISDERLKDYLKRLSDMGPERVAITSVMTGKEEMSVAVFDKCENKYYKIDCGYIKRPFHGTGDIFAAVMCGEYLKSGSFLGASLKAAEFVKRAILKTLEYAELKTENGVCFEKILAEFFSRPQNNPPYKEI